MADQENYQMAIDLLSCHLGLSVDEAKEQLGLSSKFETHNSIPQDIPTSNTSNGSNLS